MRVSAVPFLFLLGNLMMAQQPMVEGNAASAVRVVIFEDLQCSDCAAFRKMLDEKLLPKYGAVVGFEHRDFPLAKHAWARKAAIATRFFHERKPALGAAFRRVTMGEQTAISATNFDQHLEAFAKKHGVDPALALASLQDARLQEQVEKDFQDGIARGIARTPTALVNGEPFIEEFTFEEIAKSIEENLKQAGRQ